MTRRPHVPAVAVALAVALAVAACGRAPADPRPLDAGATPVTAASTVATASTAAGASTTASPGAASAGAATTASPAGPTVKVVAVGDIACPPDDPSYNGGKGTARHCQQAAVAADVAAAAPSALLLVGDLQYRDGTPAEFAAVWATTWGKLPMVQYPVPGNHEYNSGKPVGYFATFPSGRGDAGTSWYRAQIGTWVVLALDSNCRAIGGCGADAAETQWLRSQLADAKGRCILAMWHHPLTTSTDLTKADNGPGGATSAAPADPGYDGRFAPWWSMLVDAGAALVLNGHAHNYERFAPQDATGRPHAGGAVEFVVGTGGHSLYPFAATPRPGSEVRADTFGHLELELAPGGYTWRFVALGGRVLDQGTGTCPALTR